MNEIFLLRRLYPAIGEHHLVEEETARLLRAILPDRYIAPSTARPGFLRYAGRNIFSILFLSVYRSLGIPHERRLFYGILNHAVRGIVTATDNLLDDEYKELLPLRFPERAVRFKSVMHLLVFDRILVQAVEDAAQKELLSRAEGRELQHRLFQAMVPIGEEEAGEEGGVQAILPPQEILDSVHMLKGGNLLRLAFVGPRFVERELAASVDLADRGIYRIGMALQVIDDLTDFYGDLRERRHNYLASFLRYEAVGPEREAFEGLLCRRESDTVPVRLAFPASVGEVMHRAVGEALAGFGLLERAGFWLTRRAALALIRRLFFIRRVGDLLELLPERIEKTLSPEASGCA